MARRHLNTILTIISELVLIIGTVSVAYIVYRVHEDGIVHIINGIHVKASQ